jgi:hypothetical protein
LLLATLTKAGKNSASRNLLATCKNAPLAAQPQNQTIIPTKPLTQSFSWSSDFRKSQFPSAGTHLYWLRHEN